MSEHLFTQAWAEAWQRAINTSTGFASSAKDWNNSIGLAIGETAGIRLVLEGGCCTGAERTTREELTADYVLAAPEKVWLKILGQGRDPMWALMSGQIRLEGGALSSLAAHASAAKELLAAAREIDSDSLEESPPPPPAPEPVEVSEPPEPAPGGARLSFRSTDSRGLDRQSPAMRLWEKAKVRGIWNPADINYYADRAEWMSLTPEERDLLMRETSLFLAGEEAVTLDLLPLIQTVAAEGRLEEEIYLTSFLWEEAKHVDAFSRFFDDVAGERAHLERYHSESYRRIFYEELPRALDRLRTDPSPAAQADASVTYHMIVEGVLAETGYHAYYTMLDKREVLAGMRELIGYVQSDEARHLAYGVFFLSRLVAEHGAEVWRTIETRMEQLLPVALGVIEEGFAPYDPIPFGLEPGDFVAFAQEQFRRRFARIEKAREQTLDEVYRIQLAD